MKSGLIKLHVAVLLMGLTGLFGKLTDQSPFTITMVRSIQCFLMLGVFLIVTKKYKAITSKLALAVLPAAVFYGLHWVSFFQSVQLAGAGLGTIAFSTFPFFVVFLEPLFGKVRLNRINLALSALMFVGVYFIVPAFVFSDATFQGIIYGLFCGLFYALNLLIIRKSIGNASSIVITCLQTFFIALMMIPFANLDAASYDVSDWVYMSLLGFLCTGLGITLINSSLKSLSTQTVAISIGLEALYAVLFAFLFLGESFDATSLIGGVLIVVAGTTVAFLEGKEKRAIVAKT